MTMQRVRGGGGGGGGGGGAAPRPQPTAQCTAQASLSARRLRKRREKKKKKKKKKRKNKESAPPASRAHCIRSRASWGDRQQLRASGETHANVCFREKGRTLPRPPRLPSSKTSHNTKVLHPPYHFFLTFPKFVCYIRLLGFWTASRLAEHEAPGPLDWRAPAQLQKKPHLWQKRHFHQGRRPSRPSWCILCHGRPRP